MRIFLEIEIEATKFTSSGQRFRVYHAGEILLESTKDPSHDAARALVAAGADMDATLICRRKGDDAKYYYPGRLGHFAGTRIAEGNNHGPRLVKWIPYLGPVFRDDDDE